MRIAVVQGGPSTEAEVSRKSGQAVASALVQASHEVVRLELDAELPKNLAAFGPDVVFPALHGQQGEDGCVQGLLEVLGLPYVGSDVRASAVSADKLAAKLFFRERGLLVAGERALSRDDAARDPGELLLALRQDLGESFVVKPLQGGSTIGIGRVLSGAGPEEFHAALLEALKHFHLVPAETYIKGHELTCAVLEDEKGVRALPPTMITSNASDWYDFESKYAPGGSTHICPAPLDAAQTAVIQQAAVGAHLAVGARDLSRSDFILDESGRAFLLEINTLPGMTETSLYPEAARAAGISFPDLLDGLVRRAAARAGQRGHTGRPLPGS